MDLIRLSEGRYHIVHDHENIDAVVEDVNLPSKTVRLKLNGKSFQVEISGMLDQMIESLGLDSLEEDHGGEIHSPMPGLVLDVVVKEGDEVKEGDSLLILEAMKMENVIKAPANGTIASIQVTKNQSVEKGELLLELN